MAITSIMFICGCGFRTAKQGNAESHCENKSHQMTVSGFIKPSQKKQKVRKNSQLGSLKLKGEMPKQPEEPSEISDEFQRLRDKLRVVSMRIEPNR